MVSLLDRWKRRRAERAALKYSLSLNSDQALIADQVPELIGMDEVSGMAHVLRQIEDWNGRSTRDQQIEFATRLAASNMAFERDGLIMPYWANLWVLRTYQHALGWDVPYVAPQVDSGHAGG